MDALYVGSSDVTRGRRGPCFLPVVVVLAALLVMAPGAGTALAGHTERVSVNPQGNADSRTECAPSVSGDGRYVVFYSEATNLVAGDTNGCADVFLRDRITGETRRVSVASDGAQGSGDSISPTISADGRYVAFSSSASDLVPADTNGLPDIFVHDRQTGQTERVSVHSNGTEANDIVYDPAISADGRYAAFSTSASTLVDGDGNTCADVFVHDRQTGETERVSVASDGTEGDNSSEYPFISADGRYVVFASCATNLVADDANDWPDLFVHDRETGQTALVSVASDGTQGNFCTPPLKRPLLGVSISADGRYVAFASCATNLVDGDTNDWPDVFVHDLETGQTVRVSVASGGTQADDCSRDPSISADGRYVAFYSSASNLVAGDTPFSIDVFVHDRETGGTVRVSVASDGAAGDSASSNASISADGRYVAFYSAATNLVDGDTNGWADVFVHDRETGEAERVSVAECGTQGTGRSERTSLSADGRYVAFYSNATDLVAGDMNGFQDIFVYDRQTNAIERVSVASDGTEANDSSDLFSISADGRYVTFDSFATNLVTDDGNLKPDVFVHDRETGETVRVSVASDGTEAKDFSGDPSISAGGRYVAFTSYCDNLVGDDTNLAPDVFVHDRETGETTLVSVASDGTQGDGFSGFSSVSGDGRYVAFYSEATDLVAGDTNLKADVFVHDRETGETVRVSVASDGTEATGSSGDPAISADGRYVAFWSDADDLVAGDTKGVRDAFVHDRETGETVRVSVASDGTEGNAASCTDPYGYPSISADGRYVAFYSDATNLVAGDANAARDVFVHDRETGETVRVSVSSDGAEGNAASCDGEWSPPSISADGRCVAFDSFATNLVPGDTNGFRDIFVHERLVADFAGSPTSGNAPLTVDFTDLSSGRPTAWEWDFGDGGTSSEQNPSHTYLLAGVYTPSMTATDAYESDTEIKTDYITVGVPGVAAFSATPTEGIMGMTVTFTDESTGDIDSWAWDFGDGGTSTEQNPSHTYLLAGIYTPSMTASTIWGSDTETKSRYIWVGFLDCGPDNWAFQDTLLCVDADIVQGYPGGYYQPTWAVNRGQMAVYISRAIAGGDSAVPDASPPATFDDVSDTNSTWAWKYVEYAVAQNVVQGYDENTYAPEVEVDRGQMAVFIARGKGWVILGEDMTTAPELFPDVPAGFWAGTAVEACVNNDVVQGYLDGNYHPDDIVTRDQMAVYVARAFGLAM